MSGAGVVADHADLVYKNEKPLFVILAVLATIFWLLLIVGTLGIALIYLLLFFVGYLFAQSALISWIKGNGVKIGPAQFPDIYERYQYCCNQLSVTPYPDAYLINGGGILNAFATRFLGRNFVVLFSDVVDAMSDNPEAINFYIGHELGHIQRKHLKWGAFVSPASILPLVGAAYSRACEYTCDQFGRACCADPNAAMQGLSALATGQKRWVTLSVPAYLEQAKETKGFWMSFHEFVADYPWLVKRAARIDNPGVVAPSRSFFAGLLALFIPRLGVGGGVGGVIVMVAIIGILAAIALPAYQQYMVRAQLSESADMSATFSDSTATDEQVTDSSATDGQSADSGVINAQLAEAAAFGRALAELAGAYYEANQKYPSAMSEAGFSGELPSSVAEVFLDSETGVLTAALAVDPVAGKSLMWIPSLGDNGKVEWTCSSEDIASELLPSECQP
jgi:Zn-dependent protease with chaperone function